MVFLKKIFRLFYINLSVRCMQNHHFIRQNSQCVKKKKNFQSQSFIIKSKKEVVPQQWDFLVECWTQKILRAYSNKTPSGNKTLTFHLFI